MMPGWFWKLLIAAVLAMGPAPVAAADMRAVAVEAARKKAEVEERAEIERQQARREAEAAEARIRAERGTIEKALAALRTENGKLREENARIEKERDALSDEEAALSLRWAQADAKAHELLGLVKRVAGDLDALLDRSQQSARSPERGETLPSLGSEGAMPEMDAIREMCELLFDEMARSGQVRMEQVPIVDRSGEQTIARVLVLGNFTAAYRLGEEIGFLLYSEKSRRFFALSRLPSPRVAARIRQYMEARSEEVPIDISRGTALRQITNRPNLAEQIEQGGPIVWPILAIGLLGLLLVMERSFHLLRMNVPADRLMEQINALASEQRWEDCVRLCARYKNKPVPKVLLAGIRFRETSREDMENALQETILREVPPLERFLSTLGMLAAIAPLLGLLGTVTGMINTFHAITYYGAGDPRMMSAGISEALVTTMLGLGVAIPIMLCHTFLTRKVENMVGQMEQKAVALVNTVFKTRTDQ